tara:strand:- start:146 stop:730 length:585 start_codon:yes stop_codon:yes gene_type:complete
VISFKQYVTEADAKSLIVVDVQPVYTHLMQDEVKAITEFINTKAERVLAYFNGQDAGETDTLEDVKQWYIDNGLEEENLNKINFQEKTYAYLRGWMDDVADKDIIKVVRHMVTNRIQQSDQIGNNAIVELLGMDVASEVDDIDPIYIPDIDLSLLKQYDKSYMGGGARHECLKEITLMMNAFNIKYTLVKDFIY